MSHPRRCSRLGCMGPWAAWSSIRYGGWQPCMQQGVGGLWSMSPLPTQAILWITREQNYVNSQSLEELCPLCPTFIADLPSKYVTDFFSLILFSHWELLRAAVKEKWGMYKNKYNRVQLELVIGVTTKHKWPFPVSSKMVLFHFLTFTETAAGRAFGS